MDASTRSYHVYGKTASGASAIKAARGALTTMARRVLILVDGQRSVGELSDMLGMEAVETALAELQTLGHVEFLRRFTDPTESDAPGPATTGPVTLGPVTPEFSLAAPMTLQPVATPASARPAARAAATPAPDSPAAPAMPPASQHALVPERPPAGTAAQQSPKAQERQPGSVAAAPAAAHTERATSKPAAGAVPAARATPSQRPLAPPTLQPVARLPVPSTDAAAVRPPTPASAAPATLQPAARPPVPPTAVAAARPPAPAPSPPASPVTPSAPRPAVKAVAWQPTAGAPVWARALVVVGGLAAIGVWLSARLFVTDTTAPHVAIEPAAAPRQDLPVPSGTVSTGAAAQARPAAEGAGAPPAAVPEPPAARDPVPDIAAGAVVSGAAAAPPAGKATTAAPADPAPTSAHVPAPTAAPTVTVPAATTLHVHTQFTPEIPKPVRDRGITSGHVSVVLHVDPHGRVERVELLSATPPDVYDRNMEQIFGKWTFDPLGIPGRMTVDVDIRPPR